jgi:energy-coupling factor transporter ATP-binding protein EcfA2
VKGFECCVKSYCLDKMLDMCQFMSMSTTYIITPAKSFNYGTSKFLGNYCNLTKGQSFDGKILKGFYLNNSDSEYVCTEEVELKSADFFNNISPKVLDKYHLIFPIISNKEVFLEKIEEDRRFKTTDSLEVPVLSRLIKDFETQTQKPKSALELAMEALLAEQIQKALESTDLEAQVASTVQAILAEAKDSFLVKNLITKLVVNDKPVDGIVHEDLEKVLKLISTKEPVFLYGPAGSGKTSLAVKSAEILDLPHYSISVNEQTTKTDFLGYFDAHSKLIITNFRKAYEFGGVFIIDEIDAGNPNVLTVLNSALANGFMAFPDGNVARHTDFVCVCTGNTTGNEANIQYIGRNILDAATLDRFIRIYIEYSNTLEQAILTTEALRVRDLVRQFYQDNNSDEFLSMRSLLQFDKLLAVGFGGREALAMACKPDEAVLNIAFPSMEVDSEDSDEFITDFQELTHNMSVTFETEVGASKKGVITTQDGYHFLCFQKGIANLPRVANRHPRCVRSNASGLEKYPITGSNIASLKIRRA